MASDGARADVYILGCSGVPALENVLRAMSRSTGLRFEIRRRLGARDVTDGARVRYVFVARDVTPRQMSVVDALVAGDACSLRNRVIGADIWSRPKVMAAFLRATADRPGYRLHPHNLLRRGDRGVRWRNLLLTAQEVARAWSRARARALEGGNETRRPPPIARRYLSTISGYQQGLSMQVGEVDTSDVQLDDATRRVLSDGTEVPCVSIHAQSGHRYIQAVLNRRDVIQGLIIKSARAQVDRALLAAHWPRLRYLSLHSSICVAPHAEVLDTLIYEHTSRAAALPFDVTQLTRGAGQLRSLSISSSPVCAAIVGLEPEVAAGLLSFSLTKVKGVRSLDVGGLTDVQRLTLQCADLEHVRGLGRLCGLSKLKLSHSPVSLTADDLRGLDLTELEAAPIAYMQPAALRQLNLQTISYAVLPFDHESPEAVQLWADLLRVARAREVLTQVPSLQCAQTGDGRQVSFEWIGARIRRVGEDRVVATDSPYVPGSPDDVRHMRLQRKHEHGASASPDAQQTSRRRL